MPIASILVYVSSDADDALGENVLKLPMLLALAEQFPAARLTWVPGVSGAFHMRGVLAPLVGGRIHEFITDLRIPVQPWKALRQRHPVLGRRFDLIIDTQRYFARTMFLRRIPHSCFISGTWRYALSDRWPPRGVPIRPPLLFDKLLGLVAAAAGKPVSAPNPVPVPEAWLRRAAEMLPPGPIYVGVAPGIGNPGSGRGYPLDRYLEVGRALAQRGTTPVFLMGPAERESLDAAKKAVPEAIILDLGAQPTEGDAPAGPTLTVALAGYLHAAVASDAGPAHLLSIGGAPMVSLFGPSRPEKRAPFSRSIIVLRSQAYGSNQVAAIPVDAVIGALERQIAVGPARGS